MKRNIPPKFGRGICLRLIETKDLHFTLSWRNRPEARMWFKSSQQISESQHKAWFTAYELKDDDFVFIVELAGIPIGQVSIYDIDCQNKKAEIGRFVVSPEFQGKGLMFLACLELLDLAFSEFDMRMVYLDVLAHNSRARKLYSSLGFYDATNNSPLIRMELDKARYNR